MSNFVVYNKETLEKVGDVITNHSISLEDAINLLGAERLETVQSDDPDFRIDGKEYWYDDLEMELEDDYLASIVRSTDNWDDPKCIDAMNDLCELAGDKLRLMISKGVDCSEYFKALRYCSSEEFLDGTPDVSPDRSEEDVIDWLQHGAEQADIIHLAYALQDILSVDLGI